MSRTIRLLLVEHQTLLSRCLATVLNGYPGLNVVGEMASGCQALDEARSLQPEVIVLEPEVPDGGTKLIESFTNEVPDCAVIVLTSGPDHEVKSALLAGARGYLLKDCDPDDIARAIERVHTGELVAAPSVTNAILDGLSDKPSSTSSIQQLTEREVDVLRLVARGATNREIAQELYVTEHTIKGHLTKMLGKVRLDNRVQLAIYATQHGLAESPDEGTSENAPTN